MQPNSYANSSMDVDHVIFNAGFAVEKLGKFFQQLGFTLTPLGRHSMGSINRLVMLHGCYIELIGFEEGAPPTLRPDLQRMPLGLSGIAMRDDDERAATRSSSSGFNEPLELKRTVDAAGLRGTARFRITTLRECPADLRIFLCHHYTPELVWHADWEAHGNRANGLQWVRVGSATPELLHAALRTALAIDSPRACEHYRTDTMRIETQAAGQRSALAIEARDLQKLAATLRDRDVAHTIDANGAMTVPLPAAFNSDLVFVEAS